MGQVLYCADSGAPCTAVIRGKDQEETLKKAAAHAAEAHGIDPVPPEMEQKMISLMRDE